MRKIDYIKKAAEFSDQVFAFIKSNIKIGMTEKEVSGLVDLFFKKNKTKPYFPTIVASGPNGYNLHNRPSDRKLKKGEPIIIDLGARAGLYGADITRTFFLGYPRIEWQKIYKIVFNAQKIAERKLKAGLSGDVFDSYARNYISKKGFSKNFIHTLGHSFGRHPHDGKVLGPRSKDLIKKGDFVTIEPGIYKKGSGGVRIEDDYFVGKEKVINLTKFPKSLEEMIIK